MNPFKGREIYQIVIVTSQVDVIIDIDESIAKIEDKSIEFEDSLHHIYHCYDNEGGIIRIIENCPVSISYRKIKELEK